MKRKMSIIGKSLFQLPLSETVNFLIYKSGLFFGLFRFLTPIESQNKDLEAALLSPHWFNFLSENRVDVRSLPGHEEVIRRADQIINGKIKQFGMTESKLNLKPGIPLKHWSRKRSQVDKDHLGDIKFTWEPARFSWAIHLGQAAFITKKDDYAACFWKWYFEFVEQNPLNMGPNWESGQEVALRAIAWTATLHLLQASNAIPVQNITHICANLADHADRILPTLAYARAQNNNHLVSEAVGLYTVGSFLKEHPRALRWRSAGKKWFERAIQRQIDDSGEYTQHSTNYHRMMLTLSLWMANLTEHNADPLDDLTNKRLSKAASWLWNLLDQKSGHVPNLGHNDGSLILPFSTAPFADYRPITRAACTFFSQENIHVSKDADDLAIWLNVEIEPHEQTSERAAFEAPRIGNESSWGILRAARYKSRPAHADQLHVDLWYQGFNVLQDAGTFQYNAPHPWDNGLAATRVHNTITLVNRDQMTSGGRFLWLDWAQAHISKCANDHIVAAHDGYLDLGAVHERELIQLSNTHWQVIDRIYKLRAAKNTFLIDLHWLVPDWEYEISNQQINLQPPFGSMRITPQAGSGKKPPDLSISRAGKAVTSAGRDDPLLGWYSPTYGVKQPALSIVYSFREKLPFHLTTDFIFS